MSVKQASLVQFNTSVAKSFRFLDSIFTMSTS